MQDIFLAAQTVRQVVAQRQIRRVLGALVGIVVAPGVAGLGLGGRQRPGRGAEQVRRGRAVVRGAGRAQGEGQGRGGGGQGIRGGEQVQQPLTDAGQVGVAVQAGENEGEFIPVQPGDRIPVAHGDGEAPGDVLQERIALLRAVAIVAGAEVANIDQDQPGRPGGIGPGRAERLAQPVADGGARQQPGQGVMARRARGRVHDGRHAAGTPVRR